MINCIFCQKQLTDQKTNHHPSTTSEGRCEDCRAEFIEGDEEGLLSYSFTIDHKDKKFLFSAIVQPMTTFQIWAQPPAKTLSPKLTVSDITNYQPIIVLQVEGEPPNNLTPQNASQKLSLWMTFS
jgi:hypothetical protein